MDELLNLLKQAFPQIDWLRETDLVARGRLDSLDVFALISELSAHYDIRILPEDIAPEHFASAEAIFAFVSKAL